MIQLGDSGRFKVDVKNVWIVCAGYNTTKSQTVNHRPKQMQLLYTISTSGLCCLLLDPALDVIGNIEDALGGGLAHKALAALLVVVQRTVLAEVVLALGHNRAGNFLPGLPADVAGKGQRVIFFLLLVPRLLITPFCLLYPLLPLIPLLQKADAHMSST